MSQLEIDRLLDKCTETDEGCWVHRSPRRDGYVNSQYGGRQMYAHRATYAYFVADIPKGMSLDHLCRTRSCCNPWHLDPVTPKVNAERGARATSVRCVNGHEFTEANTYRWKPTSGRQCMTCIVERNRTYRKNKITNNAWRPA